MPELPEVETMRRGIAHIAGGRILDVQACPCRLKPITLAPRLAAFRRRALGRTIRRVDRVGKRVVVRLNSGDAIVIEPRMTGLVLLADPPSHEHLRLRIVVSDSREINGGCAGTVHELLYWDRRGLGSVRLVAPREFERRYGPANLGPDALALTPEILRQRLAHSRRAIKVALLDQRALAGVGNLYASEILHRCGIHPATRCDRLRGERWSRLHASLLAVLESAIEHEGSTLSDGAYRNALNQEGGYQNQHLVYDRAGENCPTCGRATIRRIVQAQRSTFFCPACQKKNSRATR
jgi:formamidopyrimidine-DNA glycosylase